MTRKYSDMNQHDALYKVARAYPGGLEALAARLDMSVNVLRNKLAPGIETHYPSFEELSLIIEHCHAAGVKEAHLPLHALLGRHGLAAFVVPEPTEVREDDLSQTVCRVMSQVGDVAEAVSTALLDGIITDAEADLIEREFQGALTVLGEWRARIRARRRAQD
ncbi:phage regulatory CII family protein [Undibacterium oligocarboniphilum]|uniref:Phage regulatory CII family protein n=1 Tax=Undibacterium oligocarboniphilum TaxID=666702 RepID=A0A850QJJ0_9BURK|nr:phage regulatory CII family protein [Undibacterium oligocarboniphilum]MBC3869286.1 phage regulatory CII family protein [Undibacterium oligocarboniphilum]NVO77665.1 phage regulatory CII family protein [Undibacterium oligocarboniphilum]